MSELDELRGKQLGLFEDLLSNIDEKNLNKTQLNQKRQVDFINDTFKNAQDYVREVYELRKTPFIQVVAVFCGNLTQDNAHSIFDSEQKNTVPTGMTGLLF